MFRPHPGVRPEGGQKPGGKGPRRLAFGSFALIQMEVLEDLGQSLRSPGLDSWGSSLSASRQPCTATPALWFLKPNRFSQDMASPARSHHFCNPDLLAQEDRTARGEASGEGASPLQPLGRAPSLFMGFPGWGEMSSQSALKCS